MFSDTNGKQSSRRSVVKDKLLIALSDENNAFAKEELARIIRNEFFNDNNPLSDEIVEAALKRSMLLEGVAITEESLQQWRENMIKGVFREILGMDTPNMD